MDTNASEGIASRLESLCSKVIEIHSSDASNTNASSSASLIETAQSFCTLVTTAAKNSLHMNISHILSALRLGTLLLSTMHANQDLCTASVLGKSMEEWTCDGITCIASLLPQQTVYPKRSSNGIRNEFGLRDKECAAEEHTEEKEKHTQRIALREALLAVLHLLLYGVSQRNERQNHKTYESDTHAARYRFLLDKRLYCAAALVQHGLAHRGAAEELLSSTTTGGQVLQRFLLCVLKDTFLEMRSVAASGVAMPSSIVSRNKEGEEGEEEAQRFVFSSSPMGYYVPLTLQASGATCGACVSVQRASHVSLFTNHSVAPLPTASQSQDTIGLENPTPHLCPSGVSQCIQNHSPWQRQCGGAKIEMMRLECVGTAALQWAFAVIAALTADDEDLCNCLKENPASLAAAEIHIPQTGHALRCQETSDFVDFMGDLVCVCAVVVRPFLTEQLEWMRCMQQVAHTNTVTNTICTNSSLHLVKDMEQYVWCSDVIARFLERYDKEAVPLPTASVDALHSTDTNTTANEEAIDNTEHTRNTMLDRPPTHMNAHTNGTNKEENNPSNGDDSVSPSGMNDSAAEPNANVSPVPRDFLSPPRAPVAPEGNDEDRLVPWHQVAALFAAAKRHREEERAVQYKEWTEWRRHNVEMAERILCMQSRRDALGDMLPREIPNTLGARRAWTARLRRRVAELERGEVRGIAKGKRVTGGRH